MGLFLQKQVLTNMCVEIFHQRHVSRGFCLHSDLSLQPETLSRWSLSLPTTKLSPPEGELSKNRCQLEKEASKDFLAEPTSNSLPSAMFPVGVVLEASIFLGRPYSEGSHCTSHDQSW